jgi:hypothetical protein
MATPGLAIGPAALVLTLLVGMPPSLRHEIQDGTDGNFAVVVQGTGAATACRDEALRVARQELTRRSLPVAFAAPAHIETSARVENGQPHCTARLPVSTLPPWR